MNCAQTKNGSRNHVIPGARSCTIVVMKFTAPSSDEKMRHQHADQPPRLALRGDVRQRRVGRPAGVGGAARHEEAGEHDDAADEVEPVAGHVQPRERHVRCADLQRHHVVAEGADGQRHDAEEHHDGAVHGAELVVELRQHDSARRVCRAEPAANHRDGLTRVGKLPPHHRHQQKTEQQEHQAGDRVLDADDLVVDRKDVFPEKARFSVSVFVCRAVRCCRVTNCRHVIQRCDSFEPGLGAETG